ncbi:MAG: hypothetical protein ACREGC_00275 [Minisyncoccia bacterium]
MATLKQKLALKKITENHGNVGQGMIEAGYTPATAKKPKNLTESKGWIELLEKELPDSLLTKVHKKLLAKKEKIVIGAGQGYSEIVETGQPHTDALRAVEMGYRLKARFIDRTDLTSGGQPIILIDQATATKYGIAPSAKTDSERPAQV